MTEVPTRQKVLRRILWFALSGATASSIYLEWVPIPGRIIFGGILGGLAGLAFSTSRRSAIIGAWIGGLLGGAIILDGIFPPIIAFGVLFHWHQLLILPFGAAFGSAIGSIIGATIDWTIKALRRISHER